MGKSFAKFIEGHEEEAILFIQTHDMGQIEEKYAPYHFYSSIRLWYEEHKPKEAKISLRTGDTLRSAWLREFLKVYRENEDELVRAKAELADLRQRNQYLEQTIKSREAIEETEILQLMPVLSR